MNVGRALVSVFFCLTVAGDLLLALFIFARLLFGLVSRWCTAGCDQLLEATGSAK
jgi:hypothetical protein